MIGVLDEEECFALLDSTTVGRVGFVRDGRIEIIPVNYRMHGRDVVIRTRENGILAGLADQPQVTFEVDHHEDLGGSAWSVLITGRAQTMTADEVAAVPRSRRVNPWVGGERELWLRCVVERISGRRVRRRSA